MNRIAFPLFVTLFVTASIAAANPKPEETWPGFRGHGMSGIAPGSAVPEKWSATENIRWKVAVPGQGWSSPIVWGDTVFLTSGISSKPFKQPTPGLYGNDYIAELVRQGLSDEEVMQRMRARDNETPEESDEIRYMVYALDAGSGKIKWEQEAFKGRPSGGRHRKNTYASETPFTDGERLYVSFGQNVGLFCYTLDGKLLWKKHWPPQPIYLDFGTASSPTVHDGRVYLLHDSEGDSYLAALDAKTGEELWRTARPSTRSSALGVDDAVCLDERQAHRDRDTRPRDGPFLRSRRQGTLACDRHVDADSVAACGERLALCRERLAGRREPPVPRHQARRLGRHLTCRRRHEQ